MKSHEERVAAGVEYLDNLKPGWYRKINLETLDIWSCSKCVLGQLFGKNIWGDGGAPENAKALGFDGHSVPDYRADAQALTPIWVKAITAKQQERGPALEVDRMGLPGPVRGLQAYMGSL